MPLTELVIDGFKSFAQKTSIKFNTGITGIVGPNGSGKSNITEAIRWVMGEGSAKALRGNNMKDIIFSGSSLRKPMNSAEVTLVFDNHDQNLNFNSEQVTVTRRILRSGDNEYLINNQAVRLKDIRALFLDSGLSQNSLAIISQGKVDQILNSKPEERRELIEEAAGVLHFKQQKQAAKNQLEKTNDNLIRINDLVKELEARLQPLEEQASLAKEYKFQKNNLDQKLKTLLAFEIQNLTKQKGTFQEKADKNQILLSKLDEEVKTSKASLEAKRTEFQKLTEQKENIQTELFDLTQQISEANTNLQVAEQSKKFDEATKSEYHKQIADFKQQIHKLTADLEEISKNEADLKQQNQNLKLKKQDLLQQKTDPADLNAELEQKRNDYIQLLQDQTSVNNELVYLRTELKRTRDDSSYVNNEAAGQLKLAQEKLAQLKETGQSLTADYKKQQDLVQHLRSEFEELNQRDQRLQTENRQTQNNLQAANARLEALSNIQKRHEGYYYGVRNVLNHLEDYPGIIGAVGELISFSSEYEAAMTTALGSGVQDLVAESAVAARQSINTLKMKRAGRATFLPLDGLRENIIPPSTIASLKTFTGFIDVASQLVTSSKANISPAINYLLGNVLIVDNIDTALKVKQKVRRYRIVTLDGDVISPGGSMTGGQQNKRNNSPLQTASEITQLEKKVSTLTEKLKQEQADYEQVDQKLQDHAQQLSDLKESLQSLKQKINEAALNYQNQEREVKRLSSASKLFDSKLAARDQQLKDLSEKISQNEAKGQQLEKDSKQMQAQIVDLQARIKNSAVISKQVQEKLQQLEPEIAVLKTKLENLASQKREKEQALSDANAQLTEISTKLQQISKNNEFSKQNKTNLKQKAAQLSNKQAALQGQLNQLAAKSGQVDAQISQLDQVASRNYDLRKDAAIEQESYSVEIAKINSAINQKLEVLSSDYSLTYEAAIKQSKIQNTTENREKLAKAVRLHRMSIEDIGPVNLDAIQEYQEVKERYDFLSGQQDDLVTARENLEDSMNQLNHEVETRFKTTFDQINEHFQKIFPIVFDGGKAKLELTAPDNLLETGLEIIAQPPGKKLQRLSLLSGGERALTAITLLFAMLEVKPVPFCVMDEVEAALDDANVARFAQFLQKYDLHTQFIVITHRRGTMRQADQLFGVVMQESGVSQVLSVSLKDLKEEVE